MCSLRLRVCRCLQQGLGFIKLFSDMVISWVSAHVSLYRPAVAAVLEMHRAHTGLRVVCLWVEESEV